VPIDRLLDVERQFDVGLAPLLDTAFNRSRSNVKLKEYAAAGAAWLASPVGPYVDMGEREGGRLVDDGAWFEAIEALALDGGLRSQLVLRGREWARRQTIAHGGRQWEAAFRSAIVRARREAR
jgi:glycosyltransferase involved in cell wall biosynthesis